MQAVTKISNSPNLFEIILIVILKKILFWKNLKFKYFITRYVYKNDFFTFLIIFVIKCYSYISMKHFKQKEIFFFTDNNICHFVHEICL